MFPHVSGNRLIEEGVDNGSRAEARRIWGPKCSRVLRDFISDFCKRQQCKIMIDFFASSCNSLVPRFASWSKEPGTEAVDAFSMRSWESSLCPACGQRHKELGFYFPPAGLEDRVTGVVTRARLDGARGVPTRHRAGYWMAMRRAAKRKVAVPEEANTHENIERVMAGHTPFLVDFEGPDDSVAACASAGLQRSGERPRDAVEDRRSLRSFEQQQAAKARV